MAPPPLIGLTGVADPADSLLWHFTVTDVQGPNLTLDYGDGVQDTVPATEPVTRDHDYGAGGDYTVVAHSSAGGQDDATLAITVIGPVSPVVVAYATTDELFRALKIRNPTADQIVAAQRVLDSAALEIDAEIGRTSPYPDPPALVVQVNLERAVEHWQQQEVPYGIWENALGPIVVGRDTWDRHALKLAPLKEIWGIA